MTRSTTSVSDWPSADPADPSPQRDGDYVRRSDDDFVDANARIAAQEQELREVRAELAKTKRQLGQERDRNARLRWQVESVRARRSYQMLKAVYAARSSRRLLLRLPLTLLRLLLKPAQKPPRPDALPVYRDEQTERGWRAYDEGEYEKALAEAEAVLEEDPKHMGALELKRSAHWRRGDVTATVGSLRRMRAAVDSISLSDMERIYLGRARELDPRWLPRVVGPPRPVTPRDGVVMHLLKESFPYKVNGFAMRSRYTVLCQRQAGLEPFVVTSLGFPRKDGVTEFPLEETVEGTPYFRLDLGPDYPRHTPFDRVASDTAWMAAAIGRRMHPSVIHAGTGYRGYETALVGMALREHLRRPLVYEVRSFHETTWTHDIDRCEAGEHYELRRATENRCMEQADVVVTIAEAMRQDILARGIPEEKVFVVPNGVDPELFSPRKPSAALRRKYGLEGKSVIGYVSNLDHPREGQEVLIEATARLRARGREVVCLLVGDGERREYLEGVARDAGADSVVFTGRIPHEEVHDLYALIDVFVVPRVDERAARLVTPLKPFEAMALGRPVIVSDLPALLELVKPGERGLAFTTGDAESLARTVETMLDNPDHTQRLAEEGRRWVLRERTWASNGQRYRDIYSHVLDLWARGERANGGVA